MKTQAGYARRADCRACCEATHEEEEGCDECPFVQVGSEGRELLQVFNLATEQHKDPKTKVVTTSISPERLLLAFEVYSVEDKERCFRYLARATNILNGEV